jgi:ketosteroid isomerase-like protein
VNQEKPDTPDPEKIDSVAASTELEDFLQKIPANFRWPKPDAEAVAAAIEAVHRISGAAAAEELAADGLAPDDGSDSDEDAESKCSACGGLIPTMARFCVWCGTATKRAGDIPGAAGQQHVHHHFHHLVPSPGKASAAAVTDSGTAMPRGRAPGAPGTSPGGRVEAGARQVVQNWVQACNTKHIDDLLELYSGDATVIRSNVPPVRSLPAIRAFLVSLLEAGLGDVEMESMRLEILGDIAIDLGRCKMLVPLAMGKRREERGKYLVVLVRQASGNWKILADCWASDLAVNVPVQAPPARNLNDPRPTASPPKPR